MNIVLAEAQSLNFDLSDSSMESASESVEFSNIIKDSMNSDSGDNLQVVENKQFNSNSAEIEDDEAAATALAWLSYPSNAEVMVANGSGAFATVVVSPVQTASSAQLVVKSAAMLDEPAQLTTSLKAGEPLPADGKVLPPGSDASERLSEAGIRRLSLPADIPVIPSADIDAETDSRDSGKLGMARGVSQLLAQGFDQNNMPNLDKLTESVSAKAMEMTSGHQVMPDTALARQLVISPLGVMTGSQANSPLTHILEPLNIAKPDSPSEWSQGLSDRVSWMINQKLNSASIRLDPPSLGRLEIHVRVTDEATNITINTQTGQTRDLIDNASMRLRDILQEAGYQNVNVDVGQGNQSQPEERQVAGAADQMEEGVEQSQELNENRESETGLLFYSDSLVDYFA